MWGDSKGRFDTVRIGQQLVGCRFLVAGCWWNGSLQLRDGSPITGELKGGPDGGLGPVVVPSVANVCGVEGLEIGLGLGQGLCATFAVVQVLIETLHEGGCGLVIHSPEAEECAAAAGHLELTLQPIDAFSCLLAAFAGVTG